MQKTNNNNNQVTVNNNQALTSPMLAPIVTPKDRPIHVSNEEKAQAPKPATKKTPMGKTIETPFKPEAPLSDIPKKASSFRHNAKPVKKSGYRKQMESHVDEVMSMNMEEYGVVVEDITLYGKDDERRRVKYNQGNQILSGLIGEITFRVAPGYMTWRVWNSVKREFEVKDFANYQFHYSRDDIQRENQSDRIFQRQVGDGLMTLRVIRSAKGEIYVIMPQEMDMNGNEKEAVRTMGGLPFPSDKNNNRLKAGLEAFVRIKQKRFEWQNPVNRNNYGNGCDKCQHVQRIQQHDGISEDFEGKISQKMTTDLTEDGQYTPKYYCPIFDFMPDAPMTDNLNESNAQNWKGQEVVKTNRYGEEYRTIKPEKEEVVAGVSKEPQKHIEDALAEIAEDCTHFHKSERKEEGQIGREKTRKREEHGLTNADIRVDAYYREDARADRAIIDTEVQYHSGEGKWINNATPHQMMAEVNDPDSSVAMIKSLRVRTLDGVTIYGSQEVMATFDANFVIQKEPINERLVKLRKTISMFHQAANRIYALDDEQITKISKYAMNKPSDLETYYLSDRWDNAVDRFIARGEELMISQAEEDMVPREVLEDQWADQ